MTDSLLQTKLYIQRPSPRVVNRPHLILRMNEGLARDCKLILLSAPVGYGKTTLVSNWLATLDCPGAWLSLDVNDNDPLRFWIYLIAALQTTQPEFGHTVLTLLRTAQMPPIEKILSDLINQITALSDKIILVLDDYHLIETTEIHQGLNFLLDHLPPQLHLVIITREDPPLPLPKMRVKGQMIELRAKDLRFTIEESAQFLKHSMNLNLQPGEIAALEQRTEGWVAGLQMAALSMQNLADTTGFVEAFAGDDRYVVDYLIAEVFERQPAHIQEFLLQTSILRQLTAPLCDAVTGKVTGQDNLSYLENTNLFLVPLDNKRQWYRYHQLFGDLLQYRLKGELGTGYINQLHHDAGAWYAQNGFTEDAIYHYTAAKSFAQAADLIESVVIKLIVRGQLRQVLAWLAPLPDDFTNTRPLLCVCHAWVLSVTGQPAAVEPRLREAEQALYAASPTDVQDIQGLISMVRAYLARNQGNIPRSIQLLRQALADLASDNLIVRCSVNLNLGFNYLIMGQLDLAGEALQVARVDGQASDAVYITLIAMAVQANALVAQGKLRQAVQLYKEAINYGLEQNKGQPFPPAGYAYAGLGMVMYEQNELETAKHHLTKAIEFGELMGDWSMRRRGLLPMAWLKQIQGDGTSAQALWQQAHSIVHRAEGGRVESQMMAHRTRLWLIRAASSPSDKSALTAAAGWAETYRQGKPDERSYQESFAQTTLAWVELAQGKVDQALSLLGSLAENAASHGWSDSLINILTLQALAFAAQGDTGIALDTLDRAFGMAAPEGYVRTFVDYGPPMQQLLQIAVRRGNVPDYAAKLLTAFPAAEGEKGSIERSKPSPRQPLVEPLTDQELSILRLMAAGLSHHEIAGELYLSINTIKWHTTHIYGKLGVHRRAHAVSRAQEMGIL